MELTMKAGGEELLFRFTVRAWVEIEEKMGSLDALLERVDSGDRPMTAMIELCAATATAGNRYRGKDERVTADDLIDRLSPVQIKLASRLAKTALTIGMRREGCEQDDSEIIDVVLEELRQEELKKKEPASA